MRGSEPRFKLISQTLLFVFLAMSLYQPIARAGMISTEQAVHNEQASAAIERIQTALNRDDIKAQLIAMGVAPEQASARVTSLTEAEITTLADQLDELPAGGSALGTLAFVFLVLLLTDILGYTDLFPFVKKTAQ